MRPRKRFVQFWCSLLCFGTLQGVAPVFAAQPLLSAPSHTNGQLRFKLHGENKAGYVVLATTNFSDWTPVVTNQDLLSTRSLSFPATESRAFYRIQSLPTSPFAFAMAAKEQINLNGNDLLCDSYDGDVGEYEGIVTWVLPVRTNKYNNGDIIARGITNSVGVGNARIAGHVVTEPGGSILIGSNGGVGPLDWITYGWDGVKPGWVRDDANYGKPDVPQPWTGGAYAAVGAGSYYLVLPTGNYEIYGNVNLSGKSMFVRGDAVLWVEGNFIMDSASYVKMTGSGYRLTLYCGGNLALNGLWDKSIDPRDLTIYGLSTCTNITISTGTKMEALVYAPQADINLLGDAKWFGSIVGKSITLNGKASIHYDESLPRRVQRQPE